MAASMTAIKEILHKIVGSEKMKEAVRDLPKLFRVDANREEGYYNTLDGLIDIAYYMCDGCVRVGYHHIIDRGFVSIVSEFTNNAFGIDVLPSPKITSNINSTMDFVIKMCCTEVIEILAPRATAEDVKKMSEEWLAEIAEDEINRPLTSQVLISLIISLLDEVASQFPSITHFEVAFMEVHMANMSKATLVDGKYVFQMREEGGKMKIIKPAGWVEPNIKKALENFDFSAL